MNSLRFTHFISHYAPHFSLCIYILGYIIRLNGQDPLNGYYVCVMHIFFLNHNILVRDRPALQSSKRNNFSEKLGFFALHKISTSQTILFSMRLIEKNKKKNNSKVFLVLQQKMHPSVCTVLLFFCCCCWLHIAMYTRVHEHILNRLAVCWAITLMLNVLMFSFSLENCARKAWKEWKKAEKYWPNKFVV